MEYTYCYVGNIILASECYRKTVSALKDKGYNVIVPNWHRQDRHVLMMPTGLSKCTLRIKISFWCFVVKVFVLHFCPTSFIWWFTKYFLRILRSRSFAD